MLQMPQTAEKEKAPVDDRAFIQQKTQQVLDELAKVGGFAELVQKGLKSMTHKQFIMILQHLLRPIVPNIHLDGTNYIDYISNFLVTMDYPYAGLSKSSLKTPSAPHCQNSIIILLAWLTEFSLTENEAESLVEHCITEDFRSSDISKMFMQKTADAFILWNNQEGAEEILQQIRQSYIERNIGAGEDLEAELSRLKSAIDELKKETKPVCLQKTYNEKREEMQRLKQRTDELTKIISDVSHRIKSSTKNLESKQIVEVATVQELKNLQRKLAEQKMSLEEKNKLLIEITQAKSVLASKRCAAMDLNEASMENEIHLSNLIQKKFKLIDKLNNSLYKLASELEIAGMREKFDPAVFEIKTKRIGEVSSLESELEHLEKGLTDLSAKYNHEMSSINQNRMEIDGQKHRLTTEFEMRSAELTNLKVSLDQVTSEETKMENDLRQYVHEMEEICQRNSSEIKQISDEIQELQLNIKRFHEINAQLAENKATFKAKSIEQCKKLYEKRKEEVEHQRQKLAEMNQIIDHFKKRQKPFPKNVQRIIDGVVKKRQNQENIQ